MQNLGTWWAGVPLHVSGLHSGTPWYVPLEVTSPVVAVYRWMWDVLLTRLKTKHALPCQDCLLAFSVNKTHDPGLVVWRWILSQCRSHLKMRCNIQSMAGFSTTDMLLTVRGNQDTADVVIVKAILDVSKLQMHALMPTTNNIANIRRCDYQEASDNIKVRQMAERMIWSGGKNVHSKLTWPKLFIGTPLGPGDSACANCRLKWSIALGYMKFGCL